MAGQQTDTAPVVIDVRNVKKKFKVYSDGSTSLKERILFRNRRKYENRWVLNGISFQVRKGEAIGLIGENGCGKSTTLKMLTRILYPDAGTITMKGRISSLIELGAGFHQDLSGLENIYTNASIFGLSREEIDRRLDQIIAFSELEEFIDNPVRTYSSGMYMRLAFAVAINVDADILLIDEILAVGDAAFQAKCFNRLQEIKAAGTTIVIVSHSLSQIEQICERSIWIEDGLIRMEGKPREVHPQYMEYMTRKNQERARFEREIKEAANNGEDAPASSQDGKKEKRWGSGEARMDHVTVLDRNGNEKLNFAPDEPFTIRIGYSADQVCPNAVVGLAIYRSDETYIYGTNTLIDTAQPVTLERKGVVDLHIDSLPVANGSYTVDLALHRPDGFNYDFWKEVFTLSVSDRRQTPGIIYLPHSWNLSSWEADK